MYTRGAYTLVVEFTTLSTGIGGAIADSTDLITTILSFAV